MVIKNIRTSMGRQTFTDVAEEPLKVAAYYIWEKEGRLDGDDLRHWYLAVAELSSNGASPQPTRATRGTKVINREDLFCQAKES